MTILMPKDTCSVLGAKADKCDSRSLFFDRFADPLAEKDERDAWFQRAVDKKPSLVKVEAWKDWLGSSGLGLKTEQILFAKLLSRLMVNMAGGVMENAGLCLDRFGVPYIPGSAVKGCARRMAIQELLEAREAQKSTDRLTRILADIALVFGWGEQDWCEKKRDGRFVSDFAYAVGVANWNEVSSQTRSLLRKTNQFAGAVSFLPAYPYQLPAKDLELDVLTCHHQKYYEGKMTVALDTEEPNPVKFPAAAANTVFQFGVLPIRGELPSLSQTDTKLNVVALEWLRQGLETFGLGAKTAAGYGWFARVNATHTTPLAGPSTPSGAKGPALPPVSTDHALVTKWKGKTHSGNFPAFRPALAAIKDQAELKQVFDAIMPANELAKLKKSNPYWQSFVSHPDGAAILKRLKLEFK